VKLYSLMSLVTTEICKKCHKTHRVASLFLAVSQTLFYTARPRLAHHVAWPFAFQLSFILIPPAHGGMARLS